MWETREEEVANYQKLHLETIENNSVTAQYLDVHMLYENEKPVMAVTFVIF